MTLHDLCARLLPPDPLLHGETLGIAADHLTITAALSTPTAVCPTCGQLAHRIHSDYTRTVVDLPWAALLACPLMMVAMMWGMRGMNGALGA